MLISAEFLNLNELISGEIYFLKTYPYDLSATDDISFPAREESTRNLIYMPSDGIIVMFIGHFNDKISNFSRSLFLYSGKHISISRSRNDMLRFYKFKKSY